jgi:dipeptidyl aminopeptidase/acylaminoacyl peptidase
MKSLPVNIKNKETVLLFLFVVMSCLASAQDGKILDKKPLVFTDSIALQLNEIEPDFSLILNTVRFYRITYMSDNLKITGYVAEPVAEGKYPCIIANRGGNRAFGQWSTVGIGFVLGTMANWGYVAIASQYRGNDGGEGVEEFGGQEINDVLNLIPTLTYFSKADTSRIGIEGTSRGGMMTYLALKKSCRFKAAVVTAGLANAFTTIAGRPEMEKNVFNELVPNYLSDKVTQLTLRSAVCWPEKLCKTTPLLVMHGSSDWRVSPTESFELVHKLYAIKFPVRFLLFEGADHGITEFRKERFAAMKNHFDYYVRDRMKLPNMNFHGR